DSLAEAEEKHRKAVRIIALLEAEKSDLTDQVETLQGQLQKMENLLSESDQKCDELMT
ncbi:leucine-rich repeat flightless-interacting protein 1-like isoform X1, partial [Clarias magur]